MGDFIYFTLLIIGEIFYWTHLLILINDYDDYRHEIDFTLLHNILSDCIISIFVIVNYQDIQRMFGRPKCLFLPLLTVIPGLT